MAIDIPFRQSVYRQRLERLEDGGELKQKLTGLIQQTLDTHALSSTEQLTDRHFRDILERLHLDDGRKFRGKLLSVGIPYVARFSFYSNRRATGKVRALMEHLNIEAHDLHPRLNSGATSERPDQARDVTAQPVPAHFAQTRKLRADLENLVQNGPRPTGSVANRRTRDYIRGELLAAGYTSVRRERFAMPSAEGCNLIVEREGSDPNGPVLELAAHIDTVPNSQGADDNGSGVAGLLAIARYLADKDLRYTVRFCFFDAEEIGYQGSEAYQQKLGENPQQKLAGCVVFDAIGFRSHEPESQRTPVRIPGIFWPPTVADFVAVVSDFSSREWVGLFEKAGRRVAGLKVFSTQLGRVLNDTKRSDHSSYWAHGRKAILLTDTANFRGRHYHRATDTLETLDLEFIRQVCWATTLMAEGWARGGKV